MHPLTVLLAAVAFLAANGSGQETGPSVSTGDPATTIDRAALRKLLPFGGSGQLFGAVWPLDADLDLCDAGEVELDADPLSPSRKAAEHLAWGRWLSSYGSADRAQAREEFGLAAAEYRRLAEARPPGEELPLQYAEALYRAGDLDQAEGLLRFMQRGSSDWRLFLLYARLLLTRASALIAPGEPEDALLVPGARDEFLQSHRSSPEVAAAVAPLLERAREMLIEARGVGPESEACRLLSLAGLSRILVLDLLTQEAPRSTPEIRAAQLPTVLVDDLRSATVRALPRRRLEELFCNTVARALDLRAGLTLLRLPADVPRVDVAQLPDPVRGAVARACDELRARFPDAPAPLVDGACAAIAAFVSADYAHAMRRDPEMLARRIADRALDLASALLVLPDPAADFAPLLPEDRRRAESRARLLLSHAHFRAGDTWHAETLARAAIQLDPDDRLARLALASLVLRRSEDPGLLSVALRLAGCKGSTEDGRPADLRHLPGALEVLAMPALAVFHADVPGRGDGDHDDLLVEGIHLALCGDVAEARKWLAFLVVPPDLRDGLPLWSPFEQAREALALLGGTP